MASRFFATENRSFAAAYQSKGVSVISGTTSFFTLGAAAAFGAAGALATTYATKANRNNGSWVFTHANNAQTDKTFRYAIVGGEGLGYT